MDGLDELLAEVEAQAQAKVQAKKPDKVAVHGAHDIAKPAHAPGSKEPATSNDATRGSVDSAVAEAIVGRLRSLIFDIADPTVHESLHEALVDAKPLHALEYYHARPGLAQYTLETEVPRMSYCVIPREGGVPLKDPSAISTLYAEDRKKREQGEQRGPEVLWRMANQSILAGALEVVHNQVVVPHDQGGTLCLAASTENAEFTVDFAKNHLRAVCNLSFSTVGATVQQRLGLASMKLAVEAHVSLDGAECLKFSQNVEALRPAVVFDEQLVASATTLAELGPEDLESTSPSTDNAGFASVRAAAAIGEATVSAFGAAATASASALGAATRGLRALRLGASQSVAKDNQTVNAAKSEDAEFDKLFDELSASASEQHSPAVPSNEGGSSPSPAFGRLFDRFAG